MRTHAASSSVRFHYRCLGAALLTRADGSRVKLRTRKHAALLYLLARQLEVPVSRDQLVELLWSEDGEKKARHSLVQGASLINKALGEELVAAAGRDRVLLRDGGLELDATRFERHAEAGASGEARALWRGPLLDGLWLRRAPNFERWLADERERLARIYRGVLRRLIESGREGGDWRAMRASAEDLLAVDPLDEAAMLAYLESLVLLDDRTLALRRYGEFERRIRSELDAEPGPALAAWARRNRRGDGAQAVIPPPSRVSEMHVLPAVRPVFGRDEEFALLWEGWEATKRGAGCFLILEGEAGIGKTALAGKLANQVHVAGGSVCFVKCYRTEKAVPFAPITALIRQLSRLPGFVAMDPVWIGELTRLVPELRERYPDVPAPMAIDDSARHRLCDATVNAAEAVAGEQPLLIVVDDVQDADEASLALVHYLGRSAAHISVTLLCAARFKEYRSEPVTVFIESARASDLARFVKLGQLPPTEIGRIAQQVFAHRGIEPSDHAMRVVQEAASGNPLMAIEASLALTHTQAFPSPHEQLAGTPGFETTSQERLAQTTPGAQHVAVALAAAGHPLTEFEVGVVTSLNPGELEAALIQLEQSRFVRRAHGTVGFLHEQYEEIARSSCSIDDRRNVHSRMAEHLATTASRNPAANVEVAQHFFAAGRLEEARTQALNAARFARAMGASRERAMALKLALQCHEEFDLETASELASCYLVLRDCESAFAVCESVKARTGIAEEFEAEFEYVHAAGVLHSGLATVKETYERLRRLIDRSVPFPSELPARLMLMRMAEKSGEHLVSRREARALRRATKVSSNPAANAYALMAAAFVLVKYYRPGPAVALLEHALRTAQTASEWELELLCRDGLGVAARMIGQFRLSVEYNRGSMALARKTLNPQAEANALSNMAVAELALGDLEAAERHLSESAKIDEHFPMWPFRAFRFVNQGVLEMERGRLDDAEHLLLEARAISIDQRQLHTLIASSAALAVCAARRTDASALSHWSEILREIGEETINAYADRGFAEAAIAWHMAINEGRADEARERLSIASRQLARRDIDHWLSLELEGIRLEEWQSGRTSVAKRLELARIARSYEGGLVESAAMSSIRDA